MNTMHIVGTPLHGCLHKVETHDSSQVATIAARPIFRMSCTLRPDMTYQASLKLYAQTDTEEGHDLQDALKSICEHALAAVDCCKQQKVQQPWSSLCHNVANVGLMNEGAI